MPANVDAMVREGIAAYKANKMDEARALLMRAVELDEQHEMAWLWLSAVVDSDEDKQTCLENVLTINPNNASARQGLQKLTGAASAASPPAPPTPPPPAAPTATPFNQSFIDEDEELPTGLAWDMPATETSSASSQRPINEPSASDYDDWVANLGLGTGASTEVFGETETTGNDDVFSGSDFAFLNSAASREDEEDVNQIIAEEVFGGPFSTATDIDDTAFDEPDADDYLAPQNTASTNAAALRSPIERDLRSPIDDDDDTFDDEDDERFDAGYSGFGGIDAIEDEDDYLYEEEPQEAGAEVLFALIPQEISATRLPGTNERYPVLLIIGLLVLVLGNIGAVALLIMQLTGAL